MTFKPFPQIRVPSTSRLLRLVLEAKPWGKVEKLIMAIGQKNWVPHLWKTPLGQTLFDPQKPFSSLVTKNEALPFCLSGAKWQSFVAKLRNLRKPSLFHCISPFSQEIFDCDGWTWRASWDPCDLPASRRGRISQLGTPAVGLPESEVMGFVLMGFSCFVIFCNFNHAFHRQGFGRCLRFWPQPDVTLWKTLRRFLAKGEYVPSFAPAEVWPKVNLRLSKTNFCWSQYLALTRFRPVIIVLEQLDY